MKETNNSIFDIENSSQMYEIKLVLKIFFNDE